MTTRTIPGNAILHAAMRVSGLTLDQIWSKGRHPEICAVRAAMVAVARRRTTLSFPDITRHLLGTGGAHSSAVYMLRRYTADEDKRGNPVCGFPTLRHLAEAIEVHADKMGRVVDAPRLPPLRKARHRIKSADLTGEPALSDEAVRFLVFA